VKWRAAIGALPACDPAAAGGRVTRRRPRARDAPGLARPPVPRLPAGAMTSPGPATLAVPAAPGTSPGAAVTMAAGPAPAWIRMCEAIT
jgi:hypothetical protein